MIVGLVLLVAAPLTLAEMCLGQVQEGHITKKWITAGRRGNHHIQYEYDAGGIHHRAQRVCAQWQYDAIGDPAQAQPPLTIEIRGFSIFGRHLHEAILPGESRWEKTLLLTFFAICWNGVLSIFVYRMWISPSREKRLYRRGTPVPGRITGKYTRSGKSTRHYIEYQFDHPGLGVRSANMSVASSGWDEAHAGDPITVLCHPGRKRPTVVYEYGDFECV